MNTKKTVKDYIKQIGAYGILLSFFAIGFALSSLIQSSTISNLNSDLVNTRADLNSKVAEINNLSKELNSVKKELYEYSLIKPRYIDKPVTIEKPNIEEKIISQENSDTFFQDELVVSLITTSFEGTPLVHKVIANISSPSGEVIKIDKKEVGTVFNYKNSNTGKSYQITILSAGTFTAKFRVELKE